jgi:hypothetical protein
MEQAFLSVLGLLCAAVLSAQTGTEFWLAPPGGTSAHGDEPIYLNVTTQGRPAVVTLSQPANGSFNGGPPIVLKIPANSAQRYDRTAFKSVLGTRPTDSVRNTDLSISSTANITC